MNLVTTPIKVGAKGKDVLLNAVRPIEAIVKDEGDLHVDTGPVDNGVAYPTPITFPSSTARLVSDPRAH